MQWNPHVTVAALIERDGRFLLVDELVNGRQVYNQPAGHLEEGESLIEAVIRETREETCCHFMPQSLVGIYLWKNLENGETFLRISFTGTVSEPDPTLRLDSGITGTIWMDRDSLLAMQERLRSPLVISNIDDYLLGQRYPLEMLSSIR